MASGLRFVCTPPRLGDSSPSPSFSPSRPHVLHPPTSSPAKSFTTTTENSSQNSKNNNASSSSTSTFPVPETNSQRQEVLNRGPLLKFRLRERSNYLKRRNSQSQHDLKKKRKFKNDSPSNIILPTRFLLGGNIADPLNLASFAGDHSPQVTPMSSPLPTPKYKKEVEVVIPDNIHDPLNLNVSNDEGETSSPNKKKNRRKKRKRTESEKSVEGTNEEVQAIVQSLPHAEEAELIVKEADSTAIAKHASLLAHKMTLHLTDVMKRHEREEIVSPVLPQDSPSKRSNNCPLNTHHGSTNFHRRSCYLHQKGHFFRNDPLFIHFDDKKETKKKNRRKKKNKPQVTEKQPQLDNNAETVNKKYRAKGQAFRYGNYSRYYGYRGTKKTSDSNALVEDVRLSSFKAEWFQGKEVLDIGCNSGNITLSVAKVFDPKVIVGIDIDANLITTARKNVRRFMEPKAKFPISLPLSHGPVAPDSATASLPMSSFSSNTPETSLEAVDDVQKKLPKPSFPDNVIFSEANYVLDSDDLLDKVVPEYDTILCLSVTKWIHLNWGDDGLKRFFKRIFKHLRPEGRLILEPQPWPSYVKKHSVSEETDRNFKEIRMKPDQFSEYLLSSEVGFSDCQLVDTPLHECKGKSLYLCLKSNDYDKI